MCTMYVQRTRGSEIARQLGAIESSTSVVRDNITVLEMGFLTKMTAGKPNMHFAYVGDAGGQNVIYHGRFTGRRCSTGNQASRVPVGVHVPKPRAAFDIASLAQNFA